MAAASWVAVMARYPGMAWALARTASSPPACCTPKNSTTTSAMVITMLWIRSVTDAARKPPMAVYTTMTRAHTIMVGR